MKLIDKFLIKRCSTEVQVMLTRMKERPEDFDYGSAWKKLVEIADDTRSPYTKIERKLILKYWKECQLQRDQKVACPNHATDNQSDYPRRHRGWVN